MCELQFFSYEMLAIAWCVIGCSVVVGVIAYSEGKRKATEQHTEK